MKTYPLQSRPGIFRNILLLGILLLVGFQASASHFRYGNITWERTSTPRQIKFTITQAWRTDFYSWPPGEPVIGSTAVTSTLNYGDGNSDPINLNVTFIHPTDDWLQGQVVMYHTYSGTNTDFDAYFSDCCRIFGLFNNSSGSFQVMTHVTLGNSNDAPVSSIPAFINMPTGLTNATYQMPAVDPNADALTYSITNVFPFDGFNGTQPPGISISSSGLISFPTVDGSNTPYPLGTLFNAGVTITDSRGAMIQQDFLILISSASAPPVFNYGPTPANNSTITVPYGQPVTFTAQATDPDNGDVVTLGGFGVPVGGVFTPAAAANPGTATFSWTPTLAQVGNHQINMTATDNNGAQATSVVNILVTSCPTISTTITGGMGIDNCNSNTIYMGYGPSCMTLNASSSGGTSPYTYTWSTSQTGSSISVCPTTGTDYTVTAVDANGCQSNASNTLHVTVLDVRCGSNNNKVNVYHNTGNGGHQVVCISPSAVPTHIATHGDCLGDGTPISLRNTAPASSSLNLENGNISTYPNPAHGKVSIALKDVGSAYQSYDITDINGRIIAAHQFTGDVHADVINLDISNYAKGLYIIRAVTEEGTTLTKFTVE